MTTNFCIEGTFYGKPLIINACGKDDIDITYTDFVGNECHYYPCEEDCDGIIDMLENCDAGDRIEGLGILMQNWGYPIYDIPSTDNLADILTKLKELERDYSVKELSCDVIDAIGRAEKSVEESIDSLKEIILIREIRSNAYTFRWTEGHGKEPMYAICDIVDKNNIKRKVNFKLKPYTKGDDLSKIFFWCDKGVEDLSHLCRWDSGNNFKVLSVKYANTI